MSYRGLTDSSEVWLCAPIANTPGGELIALQVINSDRNHEHNTRHTAYRWGYVPYSVLLPSSTLHWHSVCLGCRQLKNRLLSSLM